RCTAHDLSAPAPQASGRGGSVPAHRLRVSPGAAGAAVSAGDVVQAPGDLGGGVGAPVSAGAGHLGAGQGLRNAISTRGGVLRVGVPAALARPQAVQAAPLPGPAACGEQFLGDRLRRGAGVVPRGCSTFLLRAGGFLPGTGGLFLGAGAAGGRFGVRLGAGAHEHDLIDRLGDHDLGLHGAGYLFTVVELGGVGDHARALLALGLDLGGAFRQRVRLLLGRLEGDRLGLGAVVGADPFDGDLEVFGGAAVHVHRDVVVQLHHDAVLTECVGHGVGAGVDVVGAAVDLDGEGDARAGFLQQVVRHVPGDLAAA